MWSTSCNTVRNCCCMKTGMPRDTTCMSTHSNHPGPAPPRGSETSPTAAPSRLDFLRVGVGGGGGRKEEVEGDSAQSLLSRWVWSERISTWNLHKSCASCNAGGQCPALGGVVWLLGAGCSGAQVSWRARRQSRALCRIRRWGLARGISREGSTGRGGPRGKRLVNIVHCCRGEWSSS